MSTFLLAWAYAFAVLSAVGGLVAAFTGGVRSDDDLFKAGAVFGMLGAIMLEMMNILVPMVQ